MRKYWSAATLVIAIAAVFAVPAARAQMGKDCVIVIQIYDNSTKKNGVCQGEGWMCVNFYKVCDGQPYPMDYRSAPGHLTIPQTRIALLDEGNPSVDTNTRLALAETSCESRSLFERLDRRQKSLPHEAKEPEASVSSLFLTSSSQ